MDILDELNAGEPANAEPQATEPQAAEPAQAEPQAEPTEPTEPKAAQPRGPDGKFARKEPEEPIMVPLQALHETRDKVKALEAQLAAIQPQQQPQAPQVPDIFEDPQGHQAFQDAKFENALYQERLNFSHRLATQQYGAELVAEAMEWGRELCATNPNFNAAVRSNADPVGFAVQQYRRHEMLTKLGDDPAQIEEYLKWREAQTAPQPAQQQQPIPSSLAADQSARGNAAPYQPPSLQEILGR